MRDKICTSRCTSNRPSLQEMPENAKQCQAMPSNAKNTAMDLPSFHCGSLPDTETLSLGTPGEECRQAKGASGDGGSGLVRSERVCLVAGLPVAVTAVRGEQGLGLWLWLGLALAVQCNRRL